MPPEIASIIVSAFGVARQDAFYKSKLCNEWVTATTWIEAVKNNIASTTGVAVCLRNFNVAMSKWFSDFERFNGDNISGVFRVKFSKKFYYYVTDPCTTAVMPLMDKAWRSAIHSREINLLRSTRSQAPADARDEEPPSHEHDPPPPRTSDGTTTPSNKRRRTGEATTITPEDILSQDYFEQGEARNLFKPRDEDEDVRATLERRIEALRYVNANVEGWRYVIKGHDPDNLCTANDIFELRLRCQLLCQAYLFALEHMGGGSDHKTWGQCCQEACNYLNPSGNQQATSGRVIKRYNILFYKNAETFPHPNPNAHLGKKPDPPLLRAYPDLKETLTEFCVHNLNELTMELVHDQLHTVILPNLFETWKEERKEIAGIGHNEAAELKMIDFLKVHGLGGTGKTSTAGNCSCGRRGETSSSSS
jgi:hypothetical protein